MVIIMNKENNVIKLRAGFDIIFDNLVCGECGYDQFFISDKLTAVCAQCRVYVSGYINQEKEFK